jgi:apolipoprotein N-acyltransferase
MLREIKKHVLLAVMSAVLLVLAFPNFNLWPLAWIGLVPLLFALEGQKPVRAFLLSYLTGILFFLGTVYWLIHVTLPGMIAVALYLGLYFGLFGFLLNYSPLTNKYLFLVYAPALWVTLEWLRAHVFTGFGWVLLGHSQTLNLPAIQIADITGAYGVGFVILLTNYTVYIAVKNFKKIENFIWPLALTTVVLFAVFGYGQYRLNNIFTGEALKVAVVQGNIPQAKKWDPDSRDYIIKKYNDLTLKVVSDAPDIVIWPETSVPGFIDLDRSLYESVKNLSIKTKAPLLVGAPRVDDTREDVYYNSAFFFSEEGRPIGRYDKIHLVPFGEYIPFKNMFSFVQRFSTMPIGDFAGGKEYTVFKFNIERDVKDKDYNWKMIKKVKFSSLICFEDIFPEISRRFVKEGAGFLVNMTNDAWFGNTNAAYQHAQCSVFRAVENRVNVVRAANTGLSCFIDQKGRIIDSVSEKGRSLFVDGYKVCYITLTRIRTFYNMRGDLFTYICLGVTLLILAISFIVRNVSFFRKSFGL